MNKQLSEEEIKQILTKGLHKNFNIDYDDIVTIKYIGHGTFGIVNKCIWQGKGGGKTVAVKKLNFENCDMATIKSIKNEIDIVCNQHHDNIVRIYGISVEENTLNIVNELADSSLFDMLHKTKSFNITNEWRWKIAKEIMMGINYLHGNDVIHRDLKSLNVLIFGERTAKLCDFGMSKLTINNNSVFSKQANTASQGGTLRWRAKETFADKKKQTKALWLPQSDIYSFGIILFELITRKVPYVEELSDEDVIDSIKNDIPPILPDDLSHIDQDLIDLMRQCTCVDYNQRPTSQQVLQIINEKMRKIEQEKLQEPVAISSAQVKEQPLVKDPPQESVKNISMSVKIQAKHVNSEEKKDSKSPTTPPKVTISKEPLFLKPASPLSSPKNETTTPPSPVAAASQTRRINLQQKASIALDPNDINDPQEQCLQGIRFLHGLDRIGKPSIAVMLLEKAADKFNCIAMLALSVYYKYTDEITKQARAVQLKQQFDSSNCNSGVFSKLMSMYSTSPPVQYLLGFCILEGKEGAEKNAEKAFEMLKKAADSEYAPAQNALGCLYNDGIGCKQDKQKAKIYFKSSHENGFVEGTCNYAVCLEEDQKFNKAKSLFTMGASKNHLNSLFYLGQMYQFALGVEKNMRIAIQYYEMAAEHGHLDASYNLGQAQLDNPNAIDKAIAYLEYCANLKHMYACHCLGQLYYNGKPGIAKNTIKGRQYMEKSAQYGCVEAALFLFENSSGSEAKKFLERAVQLGSTEAMYKLANYYYHGSKSLGYEKDINKCIKYAKQGALKDDKNCQFLIAKLYYEGKEVPKDYNVAKKFSQQEKVDRNEQVTPTAVIQAAIEQHKDSQKQKVVLIATGSYNPIHRKHVEAFVRAKQILEKENIIVVGGYISPSHESYVASKLGKYAIASVHRLEMARLAIKESGNDSWLCADTWEASMNRFIDFPYVTKELYNHLHAKFPNDNIRVMFVCGSDHFVKCGGLSSLRTPKLGVVVMRRPGYAANIKTSAKDNLFVIDIDQGERDVSSTLIRKKFEKGESISDLTFESVAQYIGSQKLF